MRDIKSNISPAVSILASSTNATVTGGWIDLRDGASFAFVFSAGTLNGGTVTPSIEDSDLDDHSDAAASEAGYIDGDLTALAANEVRTVGYGNATTLTNSRPKRYVRAKMAIAGASAAVNVLAAGIRGDLRSV